jgi:hypothetical protein
MASNKAGGVYEFGIPALDEAAMAVELKKVVFTRPQSHDLWPGPGPQCRYVAVSAGRDWLEPLTRRSTSTSRSAADMGWAK